MPNETAGEKATRIAEEERIANEKAAADQTAAAKAKGQPASFKGNDQAPEADREPVPTYRTDMGEGLPPQKDTLNPDRAK